VRNSFQERKILEWRRTNKIKIAHLSKKIITLETFMKELTVTDHYRKEVR
jgi:hypothetical protein